MFGWCQTCFVWSVLMTTSLRIQPIYKKVECYLTTPSPLQASNFNSVPRFVTVVISLVLKVCNRNFSFRSCIHVRFRTNFLYIICTLLGVCDAIFAVFVVYYRTEYFSFCWKNQNIWPIELCFVSWNINLELKWYKHVESYLNEFDFLLGYLQTFSYCLKQ